MCTFFLIGFNFILPWADIVNSLGKVNEEVKKVSLILKWNMKKEKKLDVGR